MFSEPRATDKRSSLSVVVSRGVRCRRIEISFSVLFFLAIVVSFLPLLAYLF